MTSPERRREVNAPRAGRFTPAHASLAAPPSTEVKQETIAAAPPASSPTGLTRKDGMPLAPPFMPTRAAVGKCISCTVGNEKRCLPCLCTTYTCAETTAGISGQKPPEMDRMFGGAVDGSNEEITPLSAGSNVRRSSARSTGSSPNEKSRSPGPEEVTWSMLNYLSELVENLQNKWDTREKARQEKRKELERKVIQVQQLDRECGADEDTPDLWIGVLEILHSECATKFFLRADPVGKMAIIKYYASVYGCQGGSQPRNIRRKSLLKRDKKPAEDSEVFLENNPVGFTYGTSSRKDYLVDSGTNVPVTLLLKREASIIFKTFKTHQENHILERRYSTMRIHLLEMSSEGPATMCSCA